MVGVELNVVMLRNELKMVDVDQQFSTRGNYALQGTLATSGDIFATGV